MENSEIISSDTVKTDLQIPLECFNIIIKYLDLGDIMKKLLLISKDVRVIVIGNNYILFKHFLRHMNLSSRMKRSDLISRVDIFSFIRDNSTVK